MKVQFSATNSMEAFENLRSAGVEGRIMLHRLPGYKNLFEANIGEHEQISLCC